MDGGESVINHHYDLCNKEVTAVGSWVYSPQDYPTTFDFLKRAYGIGLPLTKLISHRFKLDEITEALETNVQMKGIKIAVICRLSGNSFSYLNAVPPGAGVFLRRLSRGERHSSNPG